MTRKSVSEVADLIILVKTLQKQSKAPDLYKGTLKALSILAKALYKIEEKEQHLALAEKVKAIKVMHT